MTRYPVDTFNQSAILIAEIGRELYARGWSPATSSNYSMRLDEHCCAITISGRDKAMLSETDIMVVNLAGEPLTPNKPSAETLLHTYLYKRMPEVGAVLHTHSPNATVLSRFLAKQNKLCLANYELLKAFSSIATHATEVIVPIFENAQDIAVLAKEVDSYMLANPNQLHIAYLIRGHGMYVWGKTMEETRRHLEAMEFLLDCELKSLSLIK